MTAERFQRKNLDLVGRLGGVGATGMMRALFRSSGHVVLACRLDDDSRLAERARDDRLLAPPTTPTLT